MTLDRHVIPGSDPESRNVLVFPAVRLSPQKPGIAKMLSLHHQLHPTDPPAFIGKVKVVEAG